MNPENLGRISATPINQNQSRYSDNPSRQDLQQVDSEQRRTLDTHDINAGRTTDRAANDNLKVGERTAYDVVKAPYANVTPASEYQQQLKQELSNSNNKHSPTVDKKVALKMYRAGYSPQAIEKAMRRNNPACAKMNPAQFKEYYKKHIQPALRSKQAVHMRKNAATWKQQHGIPQSFKSIKGLSKVEKFQQTRQQIQSRSQAKHEREVIGQNRMDGVRKNAIEGQRKQPSQPQQSKQAQVKTQPNRQQSQRQKSTPKYSNQNRQPKYNPQEARARAEKVTRPQPKPSQSQGMSRTRKR